MRKIQIMMGGYLNECGKVMSRSELNDTISDMNDENKKLKAELDEIKVVWDRGSTINFIHWFNQYINSKCDEVK